MGILDGVRKLLVKESDPAVSKLYGTCVEAARRPFFYADYGVPDTVDGRFDLLLLHVCLLMLRMIDHAGLKQQLFDLMFADMDRSLREMGVGDMSIGKKMKPMLAGFYGRANAYKSALENADDTALIAALSRNLFGLAAGEAPHAAELAQYVRKTVSALNMQNDNDLSQGNLRFSPIA